MSRKYLKMSCQLNWAEDHLFFFFLFTFKMTLISFESTKLGKGVPISLLAPGTRNPSYTTGEKNALIGWKFINFVLFIFLLFSSPSGLYQCGKTSNFSHSCNNIQPLPVFDTTNCAGNAATPTHQLLQVTAKKHAWLR